MAEYEHVRYEVANRVAWLTLDRPEKLNAFNARMEREMLQAIERAGADDEVMILVVTGAGRGFCAGHDLSELAADVPPEERMKGVNRTALAVYELEKPVVAAINGVVAGGGYALALGCDIRLASEDARFLEIHVARGVVPGAESWFLPRTVGLSRAAELIFSGREVQAHEAEKLGIVSRVLPRDQLVPETCALAEELAARPTQSLVHAKKTLHAALELGLRETLDYVGMARAVVGQRGETRERARAFLRRDADT